MAITDRPFAGCEHVPAGVLGPLDWRFHQKRTCECCGRGALSRHPTKRRRTLCEECGGVMRARGVAKAKERWVVSIELDVPADVAHEADAWRVADELIDHLASDPRLEGWVGGADVRPWGELDELM